MLRALTAFMAVALLGTSPSAKPVDVAIVTTAGTIVVRLETAKAPRTSRNFLRYVDAHRYDGSTFYRTVVPSAAMPSNIEVIQGGLEHVQGARLFPPIAVEPTTATHLHNTHGTLAMARTNDPNSATAEFFINLGDDTWLDAERFPDHQGYAVFAHIISGKNVATLIEHLPANGQDLTPPVTIKTIRRV